MHDQFVKEQLAGDECWTREARSVWSRSAICGWASWKPADANFNDKQPARTFFTDVTSTTAQAFLGLTGAIVPAATIIPRRPYSATRLSTACRHLFAQQRASDEKAELFTAAEDPQPRMKKLMREFEDEAEAANAEAKRLKSG